MPKKKKAHARRHTSTNPHLWGFDYGFLPNAMIVGNLEFPGLLTNAQIDAVAYGMTHSRLLKATVPTITLLAKDPDNLKKAFDVFHHWSKNADPDAVELTLIFLRAGGYYLVISPELTRLQQRLFAYDRTHRSISSTPMWCKKLDSVDPVLQQIREINSSSSISPFILSGAVHRGATEATTLRSIKEVEGLYELLKFEATFVDEADVAPGTFASAVLSIDAGSDLSVGKSRPDRDPRGIADRRAEALACHFPVTLERLRVGGVVRSLATEPQLSGIFPWQIEQAICNMELQRELNRPIVRTYQDVEDRIVTALRGRYELADGRGLGLADIELVRKQVIADGNRLLTHVKGGRRGRLSSLQGRLRELSLLDGVSVVLQNRR